MRLSLLALLLAAPLAAQDRTYPQPGTLHAVDKALYSWATYSVLREAKVSPKIAAPVATLGLWGAGYLLERAKGHTQSGVDKVHDLAAHSLVVIPLASKRKPTVAIGGVLLLVVTWAVTCTRANPRSC